MYEWLSSALSIGAFAVLLLVHTACSHGNAPLQSKESGSDATSKPANSSQQEKWHEIELIFDGSMPPSPEKRKQWWQESMQSAAQPFWDLILSGDMDANVSFYVDQFGKYDAKADLAWVCGNPWATLPEINLRLWNKRPKPDDDPVRRRVMETIDSVQSLFAQRLVTRLLSDPALLERYYGVVIWSEAYLGGPDTMVAGFDVGVETLAKPEAWDKEHYQRASLSFLMLAHATGRDDLIKKADPQKMNATAKVWLAWKRSVKGGSINRFVPVTHQPVWKETVLPVLGGDIKPFEIPESPFPASSGTFEGLNSKIFRDFLAHGYSGWAILAQRFQNQKEN